MQWKIDKKEPPINNVVCILLKWLTAKKHFPVRMINERKPNSTLVVNSAGCHGNEQLLWSTTSSPSQTCNCSVTTLISMVLHLRDQTCGLIHHSIYIVTVLFTVPVIIYIGKALMYQMVSQLISEMRLSDGKVVADQILIQLPTIHYIPSILPSQVASDFKVNVEIPRQLIAEQISVSYSPNSWEVRCSWLINGMCKNQLSVYQYVPSIHKL